MNTKRYEKYLYMETKKFQSVPIYAWYYYNVIR